MEKKPEERLDDFVTNVSSSGNVTAKSESVSDMTLQYKDIESFELCGLVSSICVISNAVLLRANFPNVPIIESHYENSDFVVDVKYASLGATAADYDKTFPADYVQAVPGEINYISPDRVIDASTCAFPEKTWFIKNTTHLNNYTEDPDSVFGFFDWLFAADGASSVQNETYPQFLVEKPDQSVVPLTADTDYNILGDYRRENGFFVRLKKILADYRQLIVLLFALMKR